MRNINIRQTGLPLLNTFLILAIVFLGPIVYSLNLHLPYELPKVILLRVLTLCALLVFLLRLKREETAAIFEKLGHFKLPIILFVLIALWHCLAFYFSINQITFFFGDYRKRLGVWTLLHLLVFFALATELYLKHPDLVRRSTRLLAPVPLLFNLLELLQILLRGEFDPQFFRLRGSFGQPNYLAGYALFTIPLLLTGFSAANKLAKKSWYGFNVAVACTLILVSGSRVGFLLLILLAVIVLVWNFRSRSLFAALLILALTFAALIYLQPLYIFRRFDFNDSSTNLHVMTWRAAWGLISESPLFGYGYGNSIKLFARALNAIGFDRPILVDRAHNEFLDIALRAGLPVLAGIALLHLELLRQFFLRRKAWLQLKPESLSFFLAAGLAYVLFWVRGMANINGISHYIFALFLFAIIGATLLKIAPPATGNKSPVRFPEFSKYALAIALPCVCVLFVHNAFIFLADRAFHNFAKSKKPEYIQAAARLAPYRATYRMHMVKTPGARRFFESKGRKILPEHFARQKVQLPDFYFHLGLLAREKENHLFAAYYFERAAIYDPLRKDYRDACRQLPRMYTTLCLPTNREL